MEVADMATQIDPSYQEDFYAWSKAQADLLRAGRFADLDLEHLVEAVDDLGEARKRTVQRRVRTILEHLLELEHATKDGPRQGWRDVVAARRDGLLDELTPTLRRQTEQELDKLYARARKRAETTLRDGGEHAAAEALPVACTYTLDQITSDWLPE
jgi:hypothetical protein